MTKYVITISYDGSKYNGLQKLKDTVTVQGELEKVLSKMNEGPVKVVSSGRTDKGVHALQQVCTFELTKPTTPFRLRYYINRSTSKYLYVNTCSICNDEDFHPRFSCKSKIYKYVINTGSYDPMREDYVYNYNKELDIDKMIDSSKIFKGPHSFKAFVVGKHETYDSIIDDIEITSQNKDIIIRIKGKAFYTYMVRNIVSSLILVGSNKLTKEDLKSMLDTEKKVIEYSPAPAGGLYLEKVEY